MILRRTQSASGRLQSLDAPTDGLSNLPAELQELICDRLTKPAVAQLARANKSLRDCLSGRSLKFSPLLPKERLRQLIEADRPRALSRYLADTFADPTAAGALLNQPVYDNLTALMLGASLGRRDVCEVLFCHGADAAQADTLGRTAAHWAYARGYRMLSVWLTGASQTCMEASRAEPLDLRRALDAGHMAAVKELLRQGVTDSALLPDATIVHNDAQAEEMTRLLVAYLGKECFDEHKRSSLVWEALYHLADPAAYLAFLRDEGLLPDPPLCANDHETYSILEFT